MKSLVLSVIHCKLVIIIIVNSLGWRTNLTQRKGWAVKNDNMKLIPLLSDLHGAISKLHSIFFLQKCFNKRRTLVPVMTLHFSRKIHFLLTMLVHFDGISIPLDLPNFIEMLDQHHKSHFRLLWFLDKNSVVVTLFGLYMENLCHWFPGPDSYASTSVKWLFFKNI